MNGEVGKKTSGSQNNSTHGEEKGASNVGGNSFRAFERIPNGLASLTVLRLLTLMIPQPGSFFANHSTGFGLRDFSLF